MNDFISTINDVFNAVFQFVLAFLPDSPFKNISFPSEFDFFLGVLNYYIPFGIIENIIIGWLSCIIIYYGYQLILRKVNAIE